LEYPLLSTREQQIEIMAEVCPTCGLPKDLCVCGTISMEQQLVKVRLETRKWGKATTIIEGINSKSVNLNDLGAKLKTQCACGGTSKEGLIILQGDHRGKMKRLLVQFGFPETSIEVH
jgi:translation initiation factor 1